MCPSDCVGFEHDIVHKFAERLYTEGLECLRRMQDYSVLSYRKFMKTSLASCDSKFAP